MAMSRKHYREVAAIIKEQWDYSLTLEKSQGETVRAVLDSVASNLATMFRIDNSNFNRDQFLEACGVKN